MDNGKKVLTALASLLSAAALGITAVSVSQTSSTDAAWTDQANVQGEVTANWAQNYYSRNAWWSAKSSDPFGDSGGVTYSHFAFNEMRQDISPSSEYSILDGPNIRNEGTSEEEIYYRYSEYNAPITVEHTQWQLEPREQSSWELHNSYGRTGGKGGTFERNAMKRCSFGTPTGAVSNDPNAPCDAGENVVAAARVEGRSQGFSVSVTGSNIHLNVWGARTAVRCGVDGAEADEPVGNIDIGDEEYQGIRDGMFTYTLDYGQGGPEKDRGWDDIYRGTSGDTSFTSGRNITSDHWTKWMVVPRTITSAPGEAPYALSELGLYTEDYRDGTGADQLRGKFYFVLARSECGVQRGTDVDLPPRAPNFPPMPGGEGLTPYNPSSLRQMPRDGDAQSTEASTSTSPSTGSSTTGTTPSAPSGTTGTRTTTPVATKPAPDSSETLAPTTTRSSSSESPTATGSAVNPSDTTPATHDPLCVSTSVEGREEDVTAGTLPDCPTVTPTPTQT